MDGGAWWAAIHRVAESHMTELTGRQRGKALGSMGPWGIFICLISDSKVETLNLHQGHFPGGPVAKTSPSNAGGMGSVPGQRAKIPHGSWPKNPRHKTEAVL